MVEKRDQEVPWDIAITVSIHYWRRLVTDHSPTVDNNIAIARDVGTKVLRRNAETEVQQHRIL